MKSPYNLLLGFLLFAIVVFSGFPAYSLQLEQTEKQVALLREDIGALLEPIRQQYGVPALAAAVVKGDSIIALGVTGFRVEGEKGLARVSDKFNLGSCTKSMTATVAGILVNMQKVSWDLTLEKSFPLLSTSMNPSYKDVNLRQLLSHLGGMPRDGADVEISPGTSLWSRVWENEIAKMLPRNQRYALVEATIKKEPAVTPGETFLYSNLGVATAGAMLEQSMNESWESLIDTYLFKPLGMSSAGFGHPASPKKRDQPWGHLRRENGKLAPVEPGAPGSYNPPAIGPAGTVHCNIEDFAKYAAFHIRGSKGVDRAVPIEVFQMLHTPDKGRDYALGWAATEREWGGGTVLTHTGSNGMFFSVMWLAPLRDFAVVVVCNAGGEASATACDQTAGALINKYLP